MPEFLPESWTDPGFLPAVYSLALAAAGLMALAILLYRRHRYSGYQWPGVEAWNIDWLEAGGFFLLFFSWSLLAGTVSRKVLVLPENPSDNLLAWQAVTDGAILQGGMLLLFFFFTLSLPFLRRPPLSREKLGWKSALGTGFLYFLAFIPVRFAVELAWTGLLGQLAKMGVSVPMQEQDIAGNFASAGPLAFSALLVLAVCVAPVVEELVFRAGLYRFFKSRMAGRTAIVLASTLFALAHLNVLVFPTLFLFGAALCLAYEATGSLRVPIALHALFNLNSIVLIALSHS